MKYSAKTGCFYFDRQQAPEDAIFVSDEAAQAAMERDPLSTLSVINGEVVVVQEGDAGKLARAKAAKAAEIEAAFQASEAAPVSVNGWKFKGGFTSGLAIDAQRRLAEMYHQLNPAAPETATFFDVQGQPLTVPLLSDKEIDAADICLSVGVIVGQNTFKYEQLRNAVWAATTVEEVAAISWED